LKSWLRPSLSDDEIQRDQGIRHFVVEQKKRASKTTKKVPEKRKGAETHCFRALPTHVNAEHAAEWHPLASLDATVCHLSSFFDDFLQVWKKMLQNCHLSQASKTAMGRPWLQLKLALFSMRFEDLFELEDVSQFFKCHL